MEWRPNCCRDVSIKEKRRTCCLLALALSMSLPISGFSDDAALANNPRPKKSRIAVRAKSVIPTSHISGVEQSEQKETDVSRNFRFESSAALSQLQSLETAPIDLASAFALIGVQNPQFLAAQQRVLEATALRQLAAVQLLPTINLGGSGDSHRGVLQQPDGNILKVNRDSLYLGAGANAVGASTVNIPGVVWSFNVSDNIYSYLAARQVEAQRLAGVDAANYDVQRQVAVAYLNLVRAAGLRSVAWQGREEVAEVARITAAFAKAGQGRPADADRAASELGSRDGDVIDAEALFVRTSARLASLVGLDTAVRLSPVDRWAVPHSIVPEPIPMPELLAIAILQRPELAEQRADVQRALLTLNAAEMLPFSPNVLIGFSAGALGGGSNLASEPVGTTDFAFGQERFGNFDSRTDLDVVVFWSLRNLGFGNRAQMAASASRFRQSQWKELMVLDRVRAEVATAFTRVHARVHQQRTAEEAVREAEIAWKEDLARTRGNEGLPIEVLNSQRLLYKSRIALLNTIVDYNIAQFELYQALGQPPADVLIRSADGDIDRNAPAEEGR